MAREGYLVNQGEDTIHSNEIKLQTPKQKRQNWWFYHKIHVLVAVIVIAVVGSFIHSMVSRVSPDYSVAILSSGPYPGDVLKDISRQLEPYAKDLNKDGKVVVEVNNYTVTAGQGNSAGDPAMAQAGVVKFIGDTSSFQSVIFFADKESLVQSQGQDAFFSYINGKPAPKGESDCAKMGIPWKDCKPLTQMNLTSSSTDLTSKDLQALCSHLYMCTRSIDGTSFAKDPKKMQYYKESREMFERIIKNEKVNKSSK